MLLDALIGWADVGRTGWTRSATNGMIWELTANVENVASRWDHGSRMRRKKIWPGAERRWAEWEDGDRSWHDWDYVSTSERLWRHQKQYFLRWWLNPIHSNSPTSWSDVWFHEHGPMKHSSELSPPTTDLDGSLQSEPYRWRVSPPKFTWAQSRNGCLRHGGRGLSRVWRSNRLMLSYSRLQNHNPQPWHTSPESFMWFNFSLQHRAITLVKLSSAQHLQRKWCWCSLDPDAIGDRHRITQMIIRSGPIVIQQRGGTDLKLGYREAVENFTWG